MGFNSRLGALLASILKVKLKYLDVWNQRRSEIAKLYDQAFADVEEIITPKVDSWAKPVYHLYVIKVENRDILKQKLNEIGIGGGYTIRSPYIYLKLTSFSGIQKVVPNGWRKRL